MTKLNKHKMQLIWFSSICYAFIIEVEYERFELTNSKELFKVADEMFYEELLVSERVIRHFYIPLLSPAFHCDRWLSICERLSAGHRMTPASGPTREVLHLHRFDTRNLRHLTRLIHSPVPLPEVSKGFASEHRRHSPRFQRDKNPGFSCLARKIGLYCSWNGSVFSMAFESIYVRSK